MKRKIWTICFVISLLVHITIFTVLAQCIPPLVAQRQQQEIQANLEEQPPIEVELGTVSNEPIAEPGQIEASLGGEENSGKTNGPSSVTGLGEKASTKPARTVTNTGVMAQPAERVAGISTASVPDTGNKFGVLGNSNGENNNKESANGIFSSGKSSRLPFVINGPAPPYPAEARENGWAGTVKIRVLIAESGSVAEAMIVHSSGYSNLDDAALRAISRWLFSPAYKDGLNVAAWVTVPVIFELQ